MPRFQYDINGSTATVDVPDELADWHRARGHVEVDVPAAPAPGAAVEEFVGALKGAALDAALEAAKIAHPSGMKAADKRDAIVDALTPEEKTA